MWSSNEGYDPFQYRIFDKIYQDLDDYRIPLNNSCLYHVNLIIDTLHDVWKKMSGETHGIKCIPFNNELFDFYDKTATKCRKIKIVVKSWIKFLLLNRTYKDTPNRSHFINVKKQ